MTWLNFRGLANRMTATADTSSSSNPSLLYRLFFDKELRSVTIQVITMALIFAFFFFIVNNAITNLETIGKGYSFSFLWDASNYDINQHPDRIQFSQSALARCHSSASSTPCWWRLPELFSRPLLDFCSACYACPVTGWSTGSFMSTSNTYATYRCYSIFYWFTVSSWTRYRFQKMRWWPSTAHCFWLTAASTTPKPLFEPAMWAVLIAFVIGIGFTIWFKGYAKKIQDATGKIYPVLCWSALAPLYSSPIIVFFLAGLPVNFEYPELKGFNFKGGLVLRPEFVALWLALSLYTAAFIAEIVRAGIQAISHGQTEAAFALGIKPSRTMSAGNYPTGIARHYSRRFPASISTSPRIRRSR